MDQKTRDMIRGWVNDDHGDTERTARYIARMIHCGIRQARRLVSEALQPDTPGPGDQTAGA